jgi:predicted HTH domain antitoxin
MQQPSADSISVVPASNASDARSAQTLTLTLPASLARELDSATHDFLVELLARGLREFRVEAALERYARGGISFGAAATQAGVSQAELARFAYARGMEPPTSEETLAEELGPAPRPMSPPGSAR